MVYQIISDAEILVDCEIFVGHVHLLLYLSKSQLLLEKMKRVSGDFSHRFQWKTVLVGSFNEEESEFIRFSLESYQPWASGPVLIFMSVFDF